MMTVQVEPSRQLVTLSYSARVTSEEMQRGMQEVTAALAHLKPGFRLLNNLSSLEFMDPGCAAQIVEIMKLCNDHRIGTVVRVIPDPSKDIGFNIMSRFHYSPEVALRIYDNLADAVQSLES
jgi:hypothetical protein